MFTLCEDCRGMVDVEMLKSVDDVISALGGEVGTAGVAGVTVPAVYNWRSRGKIPPRKSALITDALAKCGKEPSRSVFGLELADEAHT